LNVAFATPGCDRYSALTALLACPNVVGCTGAVKILGGGTLAVEEDDAPEPPQPASAAATVTAATSQPAQTLDVDTERRTLPSLSPRRRHAGAG